MSKSKDLKNKSNLKSYFGITRVTGSLRTQHIYPHNGNDEFKCRSKASIQTELERKEAAGLVYDFCGSYPVKRKPPEPKK